MIIDGEGNQHLQSTNSRHTIEAECLPIKDAEKGERNCQSSSLVVKLITIF